MEYQFVMHPDGNVITRQRLERYARELGGQVVEYGDYHTKPSCFQSFLGRWFPIDFAQPKINGASVKVRFMDEDTRELFKNKLRKKKVRIEQEKTLEEVGLAGKVA